MGERISRVEVGNSVPHHLFLLPHHPMLKTTPPPLTGKPRATREEGKRLGFNPSRAGQGTSLQKVNSQVSSSKLNPPVEPIPLISLSPSLRQHKTIRSLTHPIPKRSIHQRKNHTQRTPILSPHPRFCNRCIKHARTNPQPPSSHGAKKKKPEKKSGESSPITVHFVPDTPSCDIQLMIGSSLRYTKTAF